MGFAAQSSPAAEPAGPYPDPDFRQLDSWIVIHEDSTATFYVGKTDCGQGTGTGFRQLMSDELDIAYDKTTCIMGSTDITVDQTTDAVTLRAVFPNPSGLLLPGMFVRATIVEGVDPAGLLIPEQGVGHDQKGQPPALVVNGNGAVELRQLSVGQTVGNKWLVTAGLKAGDRVIVEGTQSAEPGAQVRAIPADNVR